MDEILTKNVLEYFQAEKGAFYFQMKILLQIIRPLSIVCWVLLPPFFLKSPYVLLLTLPLLGFGMHHRIL